MVTASFLKDLLIIASFSVDILIRIPGDSLAKKTQRLLFNIEKKDKWKVNDIETQYQMEICLDEVNQI